MSETACVFWDGDWAKYTMTGGEADFWFDKQNQKILAVCYLLADEVITPAGEKAKPPKAFDWSLEYPWISDLDRDWDVIFHIKTETKWQQFCKLLNITPEYRFYDDELLVADGLK